MQFCVMIVTVPHSWLGDWDKAKTIRSRIEDACKEAWTSMSGIYDEELNATDVSGGILSGCIDNDIIMKIDVIIIERSDEFKEKLILRIAEAMRRHLKSLLWCPKILDGQGIEVVCKGIPKEGLFDLPLWAIETKACDRKHDPSDIVSQFGLEYLTKD